MVPTSDTPVVVVEPGSMYTRLGLAGNATPALEYLSAYAREGPDGPRQFGSAAVNTYSPNKEIYTPVMDGIVHDWPAACEQWQYMAGELGYSLVDQPLLMVEQAHNPAPARARAVQAAFEDINAPLFSMVKAPLCASYVAGRTTALVVQVGAATVSVTPIVDGVIAQKASLHSRYAGEFLSAHVANRLGDDLVPRYQVLRRAAANSSTTLVGAGAAANAATAGTAASGSSATAAEGSSSASAAAAAGSEPQLGPRGQPSFHAFHSARLASDMKQYILQASPFAIGAQGVPQAPATTRQPARYELPTGIVSTYDATERFALAEPLFKPALTPLPGADIPDSALGLSELVYQALTKLEAPPEAFIALLSNVVLCGGSTQLAGTARRLENDLFAMLPNYIPRIYIPTSPLSRTSLVWAGASVLGSLGTFDRQWVTAAEYAEFGVEQLLEKHWK